ncbi:MAG TPA: hypothetical protein VFJ82_03365 [Longimicrobium sp.]|nr:hypothetical protein [Longimicrobium sp.]
MSAPAFSQIDRTPWPGGSAEKIAVTRVRPELIARAFEVEFFEDGGRQGAAIRMRSGRVLELVRQSSGRGSGTEVHAHATDDFVSALREFLAAFDLSPEDLSWIQPSIRAEIRGAQRQAPA